MELYEISPLWKLRFSCSSEFLIVKSFFFRIFYSNYIYCKKCSTAKVHFILDFANISANFFQEKQTSLINKEKNVSYRLAILKRK